MPIRSRRSLARDLLPFTLLLRLEALNNISFPSLNLHLLIRAPATKKLLPMEKLSETQSLTPSLSISSLRRTNSHNMLKIATTKMKALYSILTISSSMKRSAENNFLMLSRSELYSKIKLMRSSSSILNLRALLSMNLRRKKRRAR